MISPIKMSIIVCGAAAGLAVAPYIVKTVLPPNGAEAQQVDVEATVATKGESVQLPIAGLTIDSRDVSSAPSGSGAHTAPSAPAPELVLSTPVAPPPAAPVVIASLPSLQAPSAQAALPAPQVVPPPAPVATSRPTPAPTPKVELPYRADVAEAQKHLEKLGLSAGKIDGKLGPKTQKVVSEFQLKEGLSGGGDVTADTIAALEKAVAALPPPAPAPASDALVAVEELPVSTANSKDVSKDDLPSLAAKVEKADADDPDLLVGRKSETAVAAKPLVVPDPGAVPTLKQVKHVKQLQEKLAIAGVYSGNQDGKWGALTIEAMKKFQENNSLEVTGKPNKSTWHKMAEVAARKEAEAVAPVEESVIVDVAPAKKTTRATREAKASLPPEDIVVSVNADAGSSTPDGVEAMATPAAVSSKVIASATEPDDKTEATSDENTKAATVQSGGTETDGAPRVKVAVPKRTEVAASEQPDTVSIKLSDSGNTKEINDVLAAAKTQIQSVSSDPYYEAEKYAPKMLDSVAGLAEKIEQDLSEGESSPDAAEASLKQLKEELDKVKHEALERKAERKVKGVQAAYDQVKAVFPKYLKAYPDKTESQKEEQEELAVLMSKIDEGFEAMNKDFKKGQYSRIVDRCDGFKTQIEILGNDLAEGYLKQQLDKASISSKLSRSAREEIKELQGLNKHFEAAQTLEKSLD